MNYRPFLTGDFFEVDMNGIICIDKPEGFTSFDVVAKLRGITKIRRIGHAGTLDPMATGVLPVFIGRATKACDMLPDSDKEYEAEFRLGVVTDTQDSTGEVLSECRSSFSTAEVEAVVSGFLGEQEQIPPMYSAVKVDGKRLYDLARQGIEVERKPRKITVYRIELLSFDEETQSGKLVISCSKGTYIRTICHDLGQRLGSGAIMTALRRTRAAGFSLSDCMTIEEAQRLSDPEELEKAILPIDRVFSFMKRLNLNPRNTELFLNGVKLDANKLGAEDGEFAVFSGDRFIATAYTCEENGRRVLRCQKQFCTKEEL